MVEETVQAVHTGHDCEAIILGDGGTEVRELAWIHTLCRVGTQGVENVRRDDKAKYSVSEELELIIRFTSLMHPRPIHTHTHH